MHAREDGACLFIAHQVLKWQDFFTEKGGNVLKGIDIPVRARTRAHTRGK